MASNESVQFSQWSVPIKSDDRASSEVQSAWPEAISMPDRPAFGAKVAFAKLLEHVRSDVEGQQLTRLVCSAGPPRPLCHQDAEGLHG